MVQTASDQVCSAADQYDISLSGQLNDRFFNLLEHGPGRRMGAEKFLHSTAKFRDAVLGHEAGVTGWKMMILKGFFDQIAVENLPWARFIWSASLKIIGQKFRAGMRAGPGLAGKSDRRWMPPRGLRNCRISA